jgi:hypothetical protein
MPILFLDTRRRTHYRCGLRLIKINMNNPKPKSDAEIIAELQEKVKQLEARNLASESKDQGLLTNPGPTGPLQTCVDNEAFKALKRSAKPEPPPE